MQLADHYKTLGVPRDASAEQVRVAYRELARRLHPDVNKAVDANQRFAVVQHAYEVLIDEQARIEYDRAVARHRGGKAGRAAGAGSWAEREPHPPGTAHYSWTNVADRGQRVSEAAHDFDDIYETFFAHRRGVPGADA